MVYYGTNTEDRGAMLAKVASEHSNAHTALVVNPTDWIYLITWMNNMGGPYLADEDWCRERGYIDWPIFTAGSPMPNYRQLKVFLGEETSPEFGANVKYEDAHGFF